MAEFDRFEWGRTPEPGETVFGCGHTPHDLISSEQPDPRNMWQWFELAVPVEMSGPGVTFTSRWVAVCNACYQAAGRDVMAVTVHEHWTKSTAPVNHEFTLKMMTDPEEIRAYLEKLDNDVLMSLALENLGS